MTSPQYKKTKQKVEALCIQWENLLDLPGTHVTHSFVESPADPSNPDNTAAVTVSQWEYRYAKIHWYLPLLATQSDQQLESIVVHEYVHVLLASIEEFVKPAVHPRLELATENVARALIHTYKRGL